MSTSGASARYTQGRYTQHLDKFDSDIVMSEKKAIPQARGGLRFTALLPVVFMAIAFVLTLLATLSGTKIGMMENCHVMTLNTTSLGQNLVEFKPATSKRDLENLLDERDPSLLNPFAASTATTTASGTAATATSTATGPFAAIGSVFNGFVNNITASIDGDLTNAEAALVAAVTKDLGVAEYYTFHMSSLCKGNLSSPSDPNAQFQPTSCESYTNASSGLSNLTSGIPSSLKIATTNITVPALAELSNSGSFLEGASKLLTNAVFAFFILSLIGSAITFLLSFVSIFLRGNRFIVYGNIFFSTIAFIFQLAASISVTVIAAGTSTIVNSFGNTVGLSSTMGMRFQALIWVSFVLILIAQEYWLAIWFVEFRRRSYKARSRTPNEIGNWLGILKEVLSDLRLKEEEPGSWSSRMEIGQPQPIRTRSYAMI